jgi:hypothetical protein
MRFGKPVAAPINFRKLVAAAVFFKYPAGAMNFRKPVAVAVFLKQISSFRDVF